jgi:ABC-2 type transport system ATP-binding protein
VIINRGRVVAEDTPENLTHQLKGASSLYVQVEADPSAADVLRAVPGVRTVVTADANDRLLGYEVEAEPERDVRRDVARTIVERGWGLLELRPTRISLEDIFLQLTTEEQPEQQEVPRG